MSDAGPVLELRHVSCAREGAELRDVSLSFTAGSSTLLIGDGSEQLLLRIASLQERPDSGGVLLGTRAAHLLDDEGFTALRSQEVGLVFPASHLLPGLSAVENVAVPLFKLLSLETAEAAERTHAILDFVGLEGDCSADVVTLSRADQQRIALARALVHRPSILALHRAEDALSPEDAGAFRDVVRRACSELGVAAIATPSVAAIHYSAHRVIVVEAGIASDPRASVER
jgi:lipoprotein-releasing system ATP-binding protein